MKPKIFTADMAKVLAVGLICCNIAALTACSNEEDNNKSPDKVERTSYDDLNYFQQAVINVDSLGNFLCRQYGVPLYENDTTHLYIGVESIEAAEKVFRYWLAPDIEAPTAHDKSITATLTDESGKPQGTVWFKPATEGGKVAEVTASSDTRLLHFNRITFLLNSAWPFNNAASKWHLGDIVHNVHLEADIEKRFKSGDIPRDWVCVRESGSTYTLMGKTIGIPPMFCAITKQSYITPYNGFYDSFWISTSKYSPGLSTAGAIKDLLTYDWDFFVDCFRESGNGELSGAYGYWVNDRHVTWYLSTYYEVYYYQTGAHYGEDSKVNKPYLLKIDWVEDGQMHDGGTY